VSVVCFTEGLFERGFFCKIKCVKIFSVHGKLSELERCPSLERNPYVSNVLRGYGTLKYGDVHEKSNFSEMQELRPLRTCQKHFETILPNFLLDECEI